MCSAPAKTKQGSLCLWCGIELWFCCNHLGWLTTSKFQRTGVCVHREILQVHGALSVNGQPVGAEREKSHPVRLQDGWGGQHNTSGYVSAENNTKLFYRPLLWSDLTSMLFYILGPIIGSHIALICHSLISYTETYYKELYRYAMSKIYSHKATVWEQLSAILGQQWEQWESSRLTNKTSP